MAEPTTEAGRALLAAALNLADDEMMVADIAAIEAEAVTNWLASSEAERRLARAIAVAYRAPDEPERPDLVVLARAILTALRETGDTDRSQGDAGDGQSPAEATDNAVTGRHTCSDQYPRSEVPSTEPNRFERERNELREALAALLEGHEVDVGETTEGPAVVIAMDNDAMDGARAILAGPPRAAMSEPTTPTQHPEATCQRCGERNPVWYAPNPVWNAVMRRADGSDEWGVVCPRCFAELAEAKGIGTRGAWRWQPGEDLHVEAHR